MQTIMDAIFGANGSAHLQFLVFAFLGTGVGWMLARPCAWNCWLTSLLVIGVSGAWLGAEFACLIGQATPGGAMHLGAATAGAAGLTYAWRFLHPRPEAAGAVAIRPSRA